MMEEAVSRGSDPVERMRTLVEEFIAWHAERHTVARVVQYEPTALPEEDFRVVAGLRRRAGQVVRDLIADGVASGAFKVTDVRTASRAVLSPGIDVARWYPGPDAGEPRRTRPRLRGAGAADAGRVRGLNGLRRRPGLGPGTPGHAPGRGCRGSGAGPGGGPGTGDQGCVRGPGRLPRHGRRPTGLAAPGLQAPSAVRGRPGPVAPRVTA